MKRLVLLIVLISSIGVAKGQQPNTLQNWDKTFHWDAPVSSPVPVSGYNFYESQTSGGPWTKINTSLITNTSFNHPAAQQGSFYAVASVAGSGLENLSDELHLVPAGKPLLLRLWQVIANFFKNVIGWA
jgi:hypothetical protein